MANVYAHYIQCLQCGITRTSVPSALRIGYNRGIRRRAISRRLDRVILDSLMNILLVDCLPSPRYLQFICYAAECIIEETIVT